MDIDGDDLTYKNPEMKALKREHSYRWGLMKIIYFSSLVIRKLFFRTWYNHFASWHCFYHHSAVFFSLPDEEKETEELSKPVMTVSHDYQIPGTVLQLAETKQSGMVCTAICTFRVPTRTGKPGKMGRHFPVGEKSGNFVQTGKVRGNHTKYWKTRGVSEKFHLLFF